MVFKTQLLETENALTELEGAKEAFKLVGSIVLSVDNHELAKELSSRDINVNSVAPGYIGTEMTNKLTNNKKEELIKQMPLGRIGTPIDIANLICFLVSDEASYITGQTFNVDGGMVMI